MKKTKDPIERLLNKVTLPAHPHDCWVYPTKKRRYRDVKIKGKSVKAHRLSYEHFKGPIPAGMLIMHSCDNPPCVNPRHLSLGTHKTNAQDSMNKGRSKTTENGKLTGPANGRANGLKSRKKSTLPVGVRKHRHKYKAHATVDGKYKHLGSYQTVQEAARAYEKATGRSAYDTGFQPLDRDNPQ